MSTVEQVTEQFLTIQGEGRSVGRLAYFIRLAGCNLWCEWCDSLHSVDPKLFKGKTAPIDYAQIPAQCNLVVLTGGEPTLFNLKEIASNIRQRLPNCEIEVESNATLFDPQVAPLFRWNLSPKLASSKQRHRELDNKRLARLKEWSLFSRTPGSEVTFKFVVTGNDDLAEIKQIVKQFEIPPAKVYLMAEGQTRESQAIDKTAWLIEAAKAEGYNFSPRLHVMFWGDRRGV